MSNQGNDSWLLFEKYNELGTDEIFRTFVAAKRIYYLRNLHTMSSVVEAMHVHVNQCNNLNHPSTSTPNYPYPAIEREHQTDTLRKCVWIKQIAFLRLGSEESNLTRQNVA